MPATVLTGASLLTPDGGVRTADLRIVDGTIERVGDVARAPDDDVVELRGYLLLPAAVEPHAHLDKAFLADRIVNATGDLLGAIDAIDSNRHTLTFDDVVGRGVRAARLMARHGFRAVRTHADVTVDDGLRSVEALAEVRRRVAGVIDVEIVAMCGWPVLGAAAADQRALLHDALHAGADVVGGCPHLEVSGTRDATAYLLDVAAEHGCPVDLHTDETLDADIGGLVDLAELVADGFPHAATASHCVSLGMRPLDEQRRVADLVAAAGIGVVALPQTNLYLQGRGHAPMPRGLTPVGVLRAAGVIVAAGADNLQDPFNPLGRACPLETAGLMMLTSHLSAADAYDTVSSAAARVTGRPPVALAAGAPADLLAVRSVSLRQAIAMGPEDRISFRKGRVIADDRGHPESLTFPKPPRNPRRLEPHRSDDAAKERDTP